ncbi:MAG: short-chain fatty acid transporter [Deltaproteobacteria bacterium]|nr:short-chain fatty acid transporter [Deltaproteobacteria bacterium]MBW1921676.1 short-chain fatty acid transporter [Deltaproteobacteria bacterium]MBW1933516.1 short-chain fatty acid transporter [Deltaproteobacteria bacterium]
MRKLGEFFAEKVRRWLPDSFSFAIILTFVAMLMAVVITRTSASDLMVSWYKGFWIFLGFSMQMSLIVVLGYAVGTSPVFTRFFDWLAHRIKTPLGVYLTVLIVGSLTAYIYWGFTVAVAVLAMEMARRVKKVDYRFLGACVYASLMPTVFGLSITAPLLMNTPKNKFIELGVVDRTYPPAETIFSSFSLITLGITVVVVFAVMLLMRPRKIEPEWDIAEKIEKGEISLDEQKPTAQAAPTDLMPADKVDRSIILTIFTCICGFAYIVYHFGTKGSKGIDLNSINFTFLIFGLAFWGRPTAFVQAILNGIRGVASIIVQFPFYAGIMGIFMFTGLSKVIADWLVSFSTEITFGWFAFVTACIVNIFIPSAGGEWMVVGPTLLTAAKEIGYPIGKLIMAYSYGDMCTNLIQPFWTLIFIPVLCKLANIRARDIMGYTAALCLVWFVVLSIIILVV